MTPELDVLRGEMRELREDLADMRQEQSGNRTPLAARLAAAISIAVALLAIGGQVYANGRQTADTQGRLDRNCRILAAIQADERFIIIQHASEGSKADLSQAQAFREIFRNSAISGCGG